REVVFNPLIMREDGRFDMDFENLEKVADDKCRLLILCNPHNPGGRIWPRETLKRLADFCAERGILVISDEIHCDMPLWGNRHIPFASVSEAAARNSITFQAPSKTFNIAGIVSSFAVVPNDEIRNKFFSWLAANELNEADIFAHIAACAAYTPQGEEWRREMLKYVEGNIEFAERFCEENIPGVKIHRPEASFLLWLDCRGLGLDQPELVNLFVKKAKLALNDGTMFGKEGTGFMRMNIAAPRSVIKQALLQLKAAVDQL
ncbi:MAG: aminotransferase class I/II-fold pyridoxal phosphate-dependent enzyme, partial [Muribaculaceae bacterium]|nr:aminotransferase class I/II-fold pyridoxal phosphate-dependent enzyme [Muribaculaceae bacterium]